MCVRWVIHCPTPAYHHCFNYSPAQHLEPCHPQTISSRTAYISSKQTSVGSCNSQSHLGGTQFFLSTKPGRQLKFSILPLTLKKNHTQQVGYIVDEGENEADPIELNPWRRSLTPLMSSKSNEVIVAIHGPDHFLFFVEGIEEYLYCLTASIASLCCFTCSYWVWEFEAAQKWSCVDGEGRKPFDCWLQEE